MKLFSRTSSPLSIEPPTSTKPTAHAPAPSAPAPTSTPSPSPSPSPSPPRRPRLRHGLPPFFEAWVTVRVHYSKPRRDYHNHHHYNNNNNTDDQQNHHHHHHQQAPQLRHLTLAGSTLRLAATPHGDVLASTTSVFGAAVAADDFPHARILVRPRPPLSAPPNQQQHQQSAVARIVLVAENRADHNALLAQLRIAATRALHHDYALAPPPCHAASAPSVTSTCTTASNRSVDSVPHAPKSNNNNNGNKGKAARSSSRSSSSNSSTSTCTLASASTSTSTSTTSSSSSSSPFPGSLHTHAFGQFAAATDRQSGHGVCVKAANRHTLPPLLAPGARAEPAVLAALPRHPHLVDLVDVYETEHAYYVVSAGPPRPTLAHVAQPPLGEPAVRPVVRALLQALAALRSAGVVHRMVAPWNVFVAHDFFAFRHNARQHHHHKHNSVCRAPPPAAAADGSSPRNLAHSVDEAPRHRLNEGNRTGARRNYYYQQQGSGTRPASTSGRFASFSRVHSASGPTSTSSTEEALNPSSGSTVQSRGGNALASASYAGGRSSIRAQRGNARRFGSSMSVRMKSMNCSLSLASGTHAASYTPGHGRRRPAVVERPWDGIVSDGELDDDCDSRADSLTVDAGDEDRSRGRSRNRRYRHSTPVQEKQGAHEGDYLDEAQQEEAQEQQQDREQERGIQLGNFELAAMGARDLADAPSVMAAIAAAGARLPGWAERFVAPEVRAGFDKGGHSADVWAVGAVMHWLLVGEPPSTDSYRRSRDRAQAAAAAGGYTDEQQEQYGRPSRRPSDAMDLGMLEGGLWGGVTNGAKHLCASLLMGDCRARVSAEYALCHPWLLLECETA